MKVFMVHPSNKWYYLSYLTTLIAHIYVTLLSRSLLRSTGKDGISFSHAIFFPGGCKMNGVLSQESTPHNTFVHSQKTPQSVYWSAGSDECLNYSLDQRMNISPNNELLLLLLLCDRFGAQKLHVPAVTNLSLKIRHIKLHKNTKLTQFEINIIYWQYHINCINMPNLIMRCICITKRKKTSNVLQIWKTIYVWTKIDKAMEPSSIWNTFLLQLMATLFSPSISAIEM